MMSAGQPVRPDASMTLITEMMQRPLDPAYAAAAERRKESGRPPATGLRSPLLIVFAILIGAMLGLSALSLRAPATGASKVKQDLVARIEDRRAHADAQTRSIAAARSQINAAQAAALSQQSQTALTAELSTLELAAGTVPVTGPGLVLSIDDAAAQVEPVAPDANPRNAPGPEQGKVIATDLQIVVNGLWDAGAEAVAINGHRLTSRAAIRSAGEAVLVDYRPLTRPYVITAIGDRNSLEVEFADNSGGSYLQWLTNNHGVRSDVQSRPAVMVPGEPALSVQRAQPVQSAVTTPTAPQTTAPQTTETSP